MFVLSLATTIHGIRRINSRSHFVWHMNNKIWFLFEILNFYKKITQKIMNDHNQFSDQNRSLEINLEIANPEKQKQIGWLNTNINGLSGLKSKIISIIETNRNLA